MAVPPDYYRAPPKCLVVSIVMTIAFAYLASAHGPREHPMSSFRADRLLVEIVDQVSVNISTDSFTEQNQTVQVTWSGVPNPQATDMIAIYVPHNANLTQTVPVNTIACIKDNLDYIKTGKGSLSVQLLNFRASFIFILIRGGPFNPVVIAKSTPVWNYIAAQPTGGHLALHADDRSIVVQWVSSVPYPQFVQFGLIDSCTDTSYPYSARSTSATYTACQMCGFPANSTGFLNPGYIHTAVIPASKMLPGLWYKYRYGHKGTGWSLPHSFLAPLGPGALKRSHGKGYLPEEVPLTFLVFNDVAMENERLDNTANGLKFNDRYGQNSTRLSNRLNSGAEANANLALMIGDLSYAQGYGADWDVFGAQFEPAFTQWPIMTAPGNHERDWPYTGDAFNNTATDSGGECNVPYMYRWYTPANAQGDPFRSFYSFNQGPVHFIMVDTESPSNPGTPQHKFVTHDLESVNRTLTPWIVVGMHRMMMAPATWSMPLVGDIQNIERLQADFGVLFIKHQVDMVLQGHEHAYARTCPMVGLNCTSNSDHEVKSPAGGPVYILAGNAGAQFTWGFPSPLAPWTKYGAQGVNGYLRLTATTTTLKMEAVEAAGGTVMDHVRLSRV